ncbi:MAG: MFS transporter [Minicystis sp.]
MVGLYTDKPSAVSYSLSVGMGFTFIGLAAAGHERRPCFAVLMVAAALVGIGSSIFHPEASRITRLASGGHHGFAQSLFQVGGNLGSSLGPVLAVWLIILPRGQGVDRMDLSRLRCSAMLVLFDRRHAGIAEHRAAARPAHPDVPPISNGLPTRAHRLRAWAS